MRNLRIVLVIAALIFGSLWVTAWVDAHQHPVAPVDTSKPEVLPEMDRLKSYARDLKAARDTLEQTVADLKLYAQRLEKVIQDKDQEIQALKAKTK